MEVVLNKADPGSHPNGIAHFTTVTLHLFGDQHAVIDCTILLTLQITFPISHTGEQDTLHFGGKHLLCKGVHKSSKMSKLKSHPYFRPSARTNLLRRTMSNNLGQHLHAPESHFLHEDDPEVSQSHFLLLLMNLMLSGCMPFPPSGVGLRVSGSGCQFVAPCDSQIAH